LTLDTISDLLLAFDAEAEPPSIEIFQNRRPSNYMHPLIARILHHNNEKNILSSDTTSKSYSALDVNNRKWQVTPAVPA